MTPLRNDMRIKILGMPVDDISFEGALTKLDEFLKSDTNHMVFTPNPEFVMAAREDAEFMEIVSKGDLIVPDGIGLVLVSSLKERVAGMDLFPELFKRRKDISVYLLGSKPGVAEIAAKKLKEIYGTNVVGTWHGYSLAEDEERIVADIKAKKPDVLLVGLGMGKQEKWIYNHKDLPVKISSGIGGVIDHFAGVMKRAPQIFIKLRLEWFYRLIKYRRFQRMAKLPVFLVLALLERFTSKN